MDPNECWHRIESLAEAVQRDHAATDEARELAQLILDLQLWIAKGGFLPVAFIWPKLRRP